MQIRTSENDQFHGYFSLALSIRAPNVHSQFKKRPQQQQQQIHIELEMNKQTKQKKELNILTQSSKSILSY